jgi:hypothetical protein
MRRLALIGVALLVTTSAMAAEQTRLAAMLSNKPAAPQSQIIRIGSCNIACPNDNKNQSCDPGKSCECSCNKNGTAYCNKCH